MPIRKHTLRPDPRVDIRPYIGQRIDGTPQRFNLGKDPRRVAHVNSKAVSWHSWADVKADFDSASIVSKSVVFNIGGNKYRQVTRILHASQKVFVLKEMIECLRLAGMWTQVRACLSCMLSPRPTAA